MAGGGGQQPLIVGIAAHHPVQHNDVSRLHLVGRGCNIHEPPRHPISHPGSFQQSRRLRLVTSRELQIRRRTGPTTEQLNLEVTHSPADLQHRSVLDAALGRKGHHPALGVVEPALAICTREPPSKPIAENGLVARGVATLTHALSVPAPSMDADETPPEQPELPQPGALDSGLPPEVDEGAALIPEAEVFVLADQAAVRVYGQIREDQWNSELPPLFEMPGADQPVPLRQAINHYAYDNSWVPDMLAGRTMDEVGRDRFDGDLLGSDPRGNLERISAAARDAARTVTDRDAIVHCSYGDVPTWDYFWQLNVARTIGAHDVAKLIGADNPLSEELARGMWEGTGAAAPMWRSMGIFRSPVPVSAEAPWRDRFLALTGRQP
jgi:hypothetical protein